MAIAEQIADIGDAMRAFPGELIRGKVVQFHYHYTTYLELKVQDRKLRKSLVLLRCRSIDAIPLFAWVIVAQILDSLGHHLVVSSYEIHVRCEHLGLRGGFLPLACSLK